MRVLLVWPNRSGFGFKSMSLALLSAILKQDGHEVRLFDTTYIDLDHDALSTTRSRIRIFKSVDTSNVKLAKQRLDLKHEVLSTLEDFRPEIVGVSALSDEVAVGVQISDVVKEWNPGTTVVWGNKVATMAPEKILAHSSVDFVCVGEGVEFMTDFVRAISAKRDPRTLHNVAWKDDQGVIHRNPLRPFYEDLDSLPYLDWSIFDARQSCKPFDGRLYVGGDHMICWGCSYSCTYCINQAYRNLYGPSGGHYLRRYSVERIISELRYLTDRWGVTFYKFHDEDFCLKPMPYFRALAETYRSEIGIPFTIMANARNINPDRVALLREMNCASVSMGIEAGNLHLRQDILKRRETKEDIIRAVHMLNDSGIRTSGFNMIGVPHETRETVMETIELNRQADVECSDTGFFYPLEGTELYDLSVSEGLFDPTSEVDYDDVNPSLDLPGISHDELVALRERFVLYVKLPPSYSPYIKRSEKDDEIGRKLMDELLTIYDDGVFANDGRWDESRRAEDDLQALASIAGEALLS